MFQNSPCSLQSKLNTETIRVKEQKIYGYDLLPQIGLTLFFFRVTLHINSVKFCGVFLRLLLIVSISTSLEMLFSSLSETHPRFLPSEICISGEEQITKVKFLLDAYRKTLNTSISPHKHTHTHHTTKEPRPHPSNFVEGFTKLLFFPVPLPTNTNNPITSRGKCFFSVMEPRPDSRNNSTSFRHFS